MARSPVATVKREKDVSLPDEVKEAIEEIGGLDELTSAVPSSESLDQQVRIHHALSDKTRLKILWAVECCDLCPCVLKEYLNISDSRLSYHLSTLEETGLITSYPKKNWKICSITELGREALGCDQKDEKKLVDAAKTRLSGPTS